MDEEKGEAQPEESLIRKISPLRPQSRIYYFHQQPQKCFRRLSSEAEWPEGGITRGNAFWVIVPWPWWEEVSGKCFCCERNRQPLVRRALDVPSGDDSVESLGDFKLLLSYESNGRESRLSQRKSFALNRKYCSLKNPSHDEFSANQIIHSKLQASFKSKSSEKNWQLNALYWWISATQVFNKDLRWTFRHLKFYQKFLIMNIWFNFNSDIDI